MIGRPVGRGKAPGGLSVKSIDLIVWRAGRRQDHTQTRTHIYVETLLARWRCEGKFGPVGVTSVGASVCVCNIMLSRRGVAGSNRSTPESGPCWVISHSPGKSPHTHTHGRARHIWPVFNKTSILMQGRRETSQQRGHRHARTPLAAPRKVRRRSV